MSTDATYPVSSGSASAPAASATGDSEALLSGVSVLGFGLIRPFMRDAKADFASAGGRRLLASAVGQVLGTRCSSKYTVGELPWRTEFGSLLYLLRHRNNDETTRELARAYVAQALARWEPRIKVTRVTVVAQDVTGLGKVAVAIRVRFRLATRNSSSNQVLLDPLDVEVPLG